MQDTAADAELFTASPDAAVYTRAVKTLIAVLIAGVLVACATPQTDSGIGSPIVTPPVTPPAISQPPTAAPPTTGSSISQRNQQLARTINFGNALEAPTEGAWGLILEENYFQLIKDAGFSAIRLPVKWSAYALSAAPYTIDPTFLKRVDWAVENATKRGLSIIVNMHHYDELLTDPAAHLERFLALWQQIADRYKTQSEQVFFEILNEPNGKLEPLWNEYATKALAVIRQSNPTRAVVIGPNGYNSIGRLEELALPSDPNLIVTVHFYDPFSFTHQGADWVTPVLPVGVVFPKNGVSLRTPWQNYSWDSTINVKVDSSIDVTYNAGWAGFYLHSDTAQPANAFRFKTNRAVTLNVACKASNDGQNLTNSVTTQAGVPMTVGCAAPAKELYIQNGSSSPQSVYTISSLELVTTSGALALLSNDEQNLQARLQEAASWGKTNQRPIFVGEFGAYSKGDLTSRVRWTAFVRGDLEQRGLSWGYWEFGAGFGIYDPSAKAWRADLLRALIPE